MQTITRTEIMEQRERWFQYFLNGEEIFREWPRFGNRDARFSPPGSQVGTIHWDKFNALSQPISHLAHWVHEKTGINEGLLRLLGYVAVGYAGYRVSKLL